MEIVMSNGKWFFKFLVTNELGRIGCDDFSVSEEVKIELSAKDEAEALKETAEICSSLLKDINQSDRPFLQKYCQMNIGQGGIIISACTVLYSKKLYTLFGSET